MASLGQDSFTQGTANIATGIAAGTGMIGFLNENAGAISVLIGFTSLIVAVIFYVLNYRLKRAAHTLYRDEILSDLVEQLKSEVPGEEGGHLLEAARRVKERRHG